MSKSESLDKGDWGSTDIQSQDSQNNPELENIIQQISQLRDSIDNVDMAVLALLAERFKYTTRVGLLKARAGFAPADYHREDYQIQRLQRLSKDVGLDPEIAEMYREFVVAEAKKRHKRIKESGEDPGVLDIFS
ncbi:MAG: chorismate mutase [Bifidobacteriaceae bacterium]|nr:chorismate mutase [Bifidobacteriaceae bacterium]